jgi:hypothetical protein
MAHPVGDPSATPNPTTRWDATSSASTAVLHAGRPGADQVAAYGCRTRAYGRPTHAGKGHAEWLDQGGPLPATLRMAAYVTVDHWPAMVAGKPVYKSVEICLDSTKAHEIVGFLRARPKPMVAAAGSEPAGFKL